MTSKIVVNNIEADAGVSTVTFGSKISSTEFVGPVVGNVTGNLTGTASTATAAATAYGISGTPTLSGITSVSTSNLTVNGNAYPSAGPLSNRNLIINGAMQVAQRGTSSGSITSSGYSSLDRWYVNASGGTYTLSQQTFTAGQTDVPGFPKNYLRFAVSTADNNIGLHQRVEDVETLGGKTATLSFWAKGTNPAGGNFVSYWRQDFGSGGSSAVETQVESNIVLTSSWQKFTITFSVPSISGKTIGTGSSTWVEILRQPNTDAGTSAWTADIAQVQLEVGSVATPFEHRSYGDELARCQRYCYAAVADGSIDNYAPLANGRFYNTSDAQFNIFFPVTMRTPPTLDSATTAAGTFFYNTGGGFGGVEATTIALNERAYNSATVYAQGASGQTAGNGTTLYSHDAEVAKLIFTAEL